MMFDWKTMFFTGVFSVAFVCNAQENRREVIDPDDRPYSEELCEEGTAEKQHCHHNREVFFSPHYYDKEYQPLTPAPDWPSANNNFIEQMTR